MFTRQEREQLRAALVNAAQADSKVTAAAHLGSAAADRLDDWSDIDLSLCISPEDELEEVIAAWTARLYQDHGAVAHCDVKRGNTLSRVFLLRNTLLPLSRAGAVQTGDSSFSGVAIGPEALKRRGQLDPTAGVFAAFIRVVS